jgi:hypothetical protein
VVFTATSAVGTERQYVIVKATMWDTRGPLFEDDVIIFQQRPNPILYSIEATRIVFVFVLCFNVAQGLLLHFAKGAPLVFLVKLTLLLDCILLGVFIVLVMLRALSTVFILTNKDAIVRLSPFGAGFRQFSVPIEDIASIEVRNYGPLHGSVYLNLSDSSRRGSIRRDINLNNVERGGSIWLSLPWSWPPLIGFYGFREYETFASLIGSLRSEA